MTETKIQPFPNGTSFMVWTELNCDRCTKAEDCRLEEALANASVTDGTIPLEVACRIGCEPEGYAQGRCLEWVHNGYVPAPPPPPMARVLRELRHTKEKVDEMFERAGSLAEYAEGSPWPEGDWGTEMVDAALVMVGLNSAIEIAEKALAAEQAG